MCDRIGQNAVCNAIHKHHVRCLRSCAMQILILQCFTSWPVAEISASGTTTLQSSWAVKTIRLSHVYTTLYKHAFGTAVSGSTVREHSVTRDHRGFSAVLLLFLGCSLA